ncbi:MAG: hypothetical protein AAF823_08595, partial [Planctomycetota bacterium]
MESAAAGDVVWGDAARVWGWVVSGLTAGLVGVVLLPWLVTFTPELVWDVDPRSLLDPLGRPYPATEVGPVGGVWWSVGLVLGSGLVMGAAVAAGARVRWWMVVLWAVGVCAAMWWVGRRMDEAWVVGPWIGGASVGLAMAHAGQLAGARRWAAAVLLGAGAALVMDGAVFVWVEQPMTVAHFEAEREAILASRGWEAGSPQAELFERRLRSPDVIGAAGFSNVLGTVSGALLLLALGSGAAWVVAARRARGQGAVVLWWAAAYACVGAMGLAWLLWATRSRAALGLTAAVGVLLGVAWVVAWWRGRAGRGGADEGADGSEGRGEGSVWLGGLMVVGVWVPALLAVGAVVVRGALPAPESWRSDPLLSLLFRWHYWEGAWGMWSASGWWERLAGVGPSGFAAGYLVHKPAINPEDVSSAHAAWVDWPVMLGVGGVAWVVLAG